MRNQYCVATFKGHFTTAEEALQMAGVSKTVSAPVIEALSEDGRNVLLHRNPTTSLLLVANDDGVLMHTAHYRWRGSRSAARALAVQIAKYRDVEDIAVFETTHCVHIWPDRLPQPQADKGFPARSSESRNAYRPTTAATAGTA